MNTVNSFQYHRLRKRGKLGYNDDEDRDRHVTTAPPPQTIWNPRDGRRGSGSSECEKEAADDCKFEAE